ncbi:MAG TPA: SatD family protein [Gemmatimonadales bacterium]
MSKAYFALIADAIDSRRLAPAARRRLQAALQHGLPELNQRYRKALAARFDITLGDELQCLLVDASKVWEVSHHIRYKFPEVDWVVACGRGPITTTLTPGITAPKVDGPCFHAARAALEIAKRDRQVFTFAGFAGPDLSAFAAYYSGLYWSWTARQRGLATQWRLSAGVEASLREELRERLIPSAVSHMRRRMAWPLVAQGDRMFRNLLEAP